MTVDILRADVELALTFTDVARNLSSPNAVAQTIQNARKAYDTISRQRYNLPISQDDSRELDSKLALLQRRLEEVGEKFE